MRGRLGFCTGTSSDTESPRPASLLPPPAVHATCPSGRSRSPRPSLRAWCPGDVPLGISPQVKGTRALPEHDAAGQGPTQLPHTHRLGKLKCTRCRSEPRATLLGLEYSLLGTKARVPKRSLTCRVGGLGLACGYRGLISSCHAPSLRLLSRGKTAQAAVAESSRVPTLGGVGHPRGVPPARWPVYPRRTPGARGKSARGGWPPPRACPSAARRRHSAVGSRTPPGAGRIARECGVFDAVRIPDSERGP